MSLISTEKNYKSAIDYEDHMKHYLQEEFDHRATKNVSIDLYISPFMTSDKPDSQCCCAIVDLSWPCNASVYAEVMTDIFLLH